MRLTRIVLFSAVTFGGCVRRPVSVILWQQGVYSATVIPVPQLAADPFVKWNIEHKDFEKTQAGDRQAKSDSFYSRKRIEWDAFLSTYREADCMYRVTGSNSGSLFDYFVIVRSSKEIRRYYFKKGDGLAAVE